MRRRNSAMEQVLVSVYIPQRTAVLAGNSQYGEFAYAPTSAELSSLSPVQRDYLFRRFVAGKDSLKLDCADLEWRCLVRALTREMERDPSFQRRQAESKRNFDAEVEARLLAAEQAKSAITRWAMSLGGVYAEGLAAGYDMEQRLVDKVQARVCEAIGCADCLKYRPNTKLWSRTRLSEQRAPNEQAFAVLRRVTGALEQIDDLPGCVSLTPRIRRCEIDDVPYLERVEGFRKRRFTAVVVEITCPCWKDSMVVVNTESPGSNIPAKSMSCR